MVVKPQVVVYHAMIDMIRLQQVFQRPRPLLRSFFDIVDSGFGELDGGAGGQGPGGEVGEAELKHGLGGGGAR